jgi:hypothetical protein
VVLSGALRVWCSQVPAMHALFLIVIAGALPFLVDESVSEWPVHLGISRVQ